MSRWMAVMILALGWAGVARGGDGAYPDEVGVFGTKIFDDVGDLGESWAGLGGRVGYQLVGPLVAEGEIWTASASDRDGASGAMVSGKLLLEGLVTGVFGRVGLARYRGGAAIGYGGGIELYLLKKLVLRGEATLLTPKDNKDIAFSFGVAFRI